LERSYGCGRKPAFGKGEPQLSTWEVGFVSSIQRLAEDEHGPLPSAKQIEIIKAIMLKVDMPVAESPELDEPTDQSLEAP
jgi:hypothetical protein